MFRPLALYVGLRYARAKQEHHFVSFISWISMLGIILGVVVLITILSVLNGFDREIKKQIFGMISPITIANEEGPLHDWQHIEKIAADSPGVKAIAPFVSGQALLTYAGQTQPVMLTGILPEKEQAISTLATHMIEGNLSDLTLKKPGIILGETLAHRLNIKKGDRLVVTTLNPSSSFKQLAPHFQTLTVIGIFRAGGGGFGFDAKLAFIPLNTAQKLFNYGSSVSALRVNIYDLYAAPYLAKQLEEQFFSNIRVGNWTEQLSDFFENIRLTKTMMFFIFILIIAVAVFNLICMMIMVVRSKQADIAILRTQGATPMMILAIFLVQGTVISLGGIVFGTLGGVALALNITDIANWLQTLLHVQLISSNIYFVNYLPSELQWTDVGYISLATFILSLLATLYPAWKAARVEPVEGLRNFG